jgi:hypothetical protein
MDPLHRIKRLIVRGRYRFTFKAERELELDGLQRSDALEAIINAQWIKKTLRSRSLFRGPGREKLYVIEGPTFDGTILYTKGKIASEYGEEIYYVLISAKVASAPGPSPSG